MLGLNRIRTPRYCRANSGPRLPAPPAAKAPSSASANHAASSPQLSPFRIHFPGKPPSCFNTASPALTSAKVLGLVDLLENSQHRQRSPCEIRPAMAHDLPPQRRFRKKSAEDLPAAIAAAGKIHEALRGRLSSAKKWKSSEGRRPASPGPWASEGRNAIAVCIVSLDVDRPTFARPERMSILDCATRSPPRWIPLRLPPRFSCAKFRSTQPPGLMHLSTCLRVGLGGCGANVPPQRRTPRQITIRRPSRVGPMPKEIAFAP